VAPLAWRATQLMALRIENWFETNEWTNWKAFFSSNGHTTMLSESGAPFSRTV
jgi:hypothetical protein